MTQKRKRERPGGALPQSVEELVSRWRGSAKASPCTGEVAKIFDFRRRDCSEKRTFAKNVRESGPFLDNPPVTVTS